LKGKIGERLPQASRGLSSRLTGWQNNEIRVFTFQELIPCKELERSGLQLKGGRREEDDLSCNAARRKKRCDR